MSNQAIDFSASDWYLVDENGNRWSNQRFSRGFGPGDPAAEVFLNSAHLVPGTRLRGVLTFRTAGAAEGTRFTLIATEWQPGQRREIVVRGLVAK